MDIIFCGIDENLCAAWENALRTMPLPGKTTVIYGDITSLKADAVVSPANSFGFMDGGVDLAYSRTFGWHVQQRLQRSIQDLPFGELLIGHALSVATDFSAVPWLISAPTMRIPGAILDAGAVFLAARAATGEAKRIGVSSLAFPGMGTGTGGVPYPLASTLMVKGIFQGLENMPFPRSLKEVFELHSEAHTGFSQNGSFQRPAREGACGTDAIVIGRNN